jgi:DNA primase
MALEKAGLDIPPDQEQVAIHCPLHSDMHPSLSINLPKGVWICHAGCGQGSIRTLLSEYLGISAFEAEKLSIPQNASASDGAIVWDDDWMLKVMNSKLLGSVCLPEVSFPFSTQGVPQAIIDRGFNLGYLASWGCGIDEKSGSLCIPIYDRDYRNVGWIKRQPDGIHPKYLYNKGLEKGSVLFGAYRLNAGPHPVKLAIVEGPLDAIWLWQHGHPAVSLLGLHMSTTQEYLISRISTPEIVVCLDNDVPGQKALPFIANRLKKYFVVTVLEYPVKCKDVQDIHYGFDLGGAFVKRSIF